jgi:hypothetical protein
MIPKPTSVNQLRTGTKADMQSGKQHKADLYRLCLDFRELNKNFDFSATKSVYYFGFFIIQP